MSLGEWTNVTAQTGNLIAHFMKRTAAQETAAQSQQEPSATYPLFNNRNCAKVQLGYVMDLIGSLVTAACEEDV